MQGSEGLSLSVEQVAEMNAAAQGLGVPEAEWDNFAEAVREFTAAGATTQEAIEKLGDLLKQSPDRRKPLNALPTRKDRRIAERAGRKAAIQANPNARGLTAREMFEAAKARREVVEARGESFHNRLVTDEFGFTEHI